MQLHKKTVLFRPAQAAITVVYIPYYYQYHHAYSCSYKGFKQHLAPLAIFIQQPEKESPKYKKHQHRAQYRAQRHAMSSMLSIVCMLGAHIHCKCITYILSWKDLAINK
jgi:hypothetical protein